MTFEGWVRLTPAQKRGRRLYVRRSAVISVESDDGERQGTLLRLAGSEYHHLISETPEQVLQLIEERER